MKPRLNLTPNLSQSNRWANPQYLMKNISYWALLLGTIPFWGGCSDPFPQQGEAPADSVVISDTQSQATDPEEWRRESARHLQLSIRPGEENGENGEYKGSEKGRPDDSPRSAREDDSDASVGPEKRGDERGDERTYKRTYKGGPTDDKEVLTEGNEAVFESVVDFRGSPAWNLKPQYLVFHEDALPVRIAQAYYYRRSENQDQKVEEDYRRHAAQFDETTGNWFLPLFSILDVKESWWVKPNLMHWLVLDLQLSDGSRLVVHVGFRALGTQAPFKHENLGGETLSSVQQIAQELPRTPYLLQREVWENQTDYAQLLEVRIPQGEFHYVASFTCNESRPHNVREDVDYFANAKFEVAALKLIRQKGEEPVREESFARPQNLEVTVDPGEKVSFEWVAARSPESPHCHGIPRNEQTKCHLIGGEFNGSWRRQILLLQRADGEAQGEVDYERIELKNDLFELNKALGRRGKTAWKCQGTI